MHTCMLPSAQKNVLGLSLTLAPASQQTNFAKLSLGPQQASCRDPNYRRLTVYVADGNAKRAPCIKH